MRRDDVVFTKLYGLSPDRVLSLSRSGDLESISVLNAHATLKAKKGFSMPEDLQQAWDSFLVALVDDWGVCPTQNLQSRLDFL
jgi:hypothetical protein